MSCKPDDGHCDTHQHGRPYPKTHLANKLVQLEKLASDAAVLASMV
jgi:hypothetical protein